MFLSSRQNGRIFQPNAEACGGLVVPWFWASSRGTRAADPGPAAVMLIIGGEVPDRGVQSRRAVFAADAGEEANTNPPTPRESEGCSGYVSPSGP